jgi:hypothetical protein
MARKHFSVWLPPPANAHQLFQSTQQKKIVSSFFLCSVHNKTQVKDRQTDRRQTDGLKIFLEL